jgi:hypothetical protein
MVDEQCPSDFITHMSDRPLDFDGSGCRSTGFDFTGIDRKTGPKWQRFRKLAIEIFESFVELGVHRICSRSEISTIYSQIYAMTAIKFSHFSEIFPTVIAAGLSSARHSWRRSLSVLFLHSIPVGSANTGTVRPARFGYHRQT